MPNQAEQGTHSAFLSENLRRRARYQLVFILLVAALVVITVLNINTGSVAIPVGEIFRILLGQAKDSAQYSIIWKIRLPRILMAALLGGGLSLSGFLLQTFFGNPIAGPFVLGISSGAKMVVALTMIYALHFFSHVSSWALIVAAFAGSLMSVGLILLLSRRLRHMAILLVAGIMIGYICSAVTDFVVTFAEDADIINLRGWSLGSFSGMSWDNVAVAAAVVGITSAVTFTMAKPIGAYQLGEAYAQSRANLLRGHRRTPPGEAGAEHVEATDRHTGGVPGRRGVLHGLRPDRPHRLRAHRIEHQHRDQRVWRAGGDCHDAAAARG